MVIGGVLVPSPRREESGVGGKEKPRYPVRDSASILSSQSERASGAARQDRRPRRRHQSATARARPAAGGGGDGSVLVLLPVPGAAVLGPPPAPRRLPPSRLLLRESSSLLFLLIPSPLGPCSALTAARLPFPAAGVLDQRAAHHPRLPPRRPLRRLRHLLRRPPPPPRPRRRLRLRRLTDGRRDPRLTDGRRDPRGGALVRASAATSVRCAVCISVLG